MVWFDLKLFPRLLCISEITLKFEHSIHTNQLFSQRNFSCSSDASYLSEKQLLPICKWYNFDGLSGNLLWIGCQNRQKIELTFIIFFCNFLFSFIPIHTSLNQKKKMSSERARKIFDRTNAQGRVYIGVSILLTNNFITYLSNVHSMIA